MGIRILVVEDDEQIADFVVRGLREEGYAVEHAADGEARWHAAPARRLGPRRSSTGGCPGRTAWRSCGASASADRRHAGALPDGPRRRLRPGPGPRRRGRRLPVQAVRLRGAAGPRPGPAPPPRGAAPAPSWPTATSAIDLATQRAERAGRPLDLTAKEQALLRLLPPPPRRGPLADADLRARLGRAVRRALEHAGGPRHGAAAQAGGARRRG